jgi:hypothetical protein
MALVCVPHGRTRVQTDSRRHPTATVRVPGQVRLCGICGVQRGVGAGFLRLLRFTLPILIPLTAPHSLSSIIRGRYNRPVMVAVPSGFCLTQMMMMMMMIIIII